MITRWLRVGRAVTVPGRAVEGGKTPVLTTQTDNPLPCPKVCHELFCQEINRSHLGGRADPSQVYVCKGQELSSRALTANAVDGLPMDR